MTATLILVILALAGAFGCRKYSVWRDRRDLFVRDRDMKKWGLRAFDQGKDKL